jgi:transposase
MEMQKLPKTQYSPEFREQAVRAWRESGLSVEAAAKSLSLPKGTLRYWVKAADKGKLLVIGQHQKPLTETELELSRLRRELAEIRMERDLLKKCVAYFAKESR